MKLTIDRHYVHETQERAKIGIVCGPGKGGQETRN